MDLEDSINSLSFSSAGDIVELVVFTQDEGFLLTLREAVGGARRLWHVPSADKVGDLLLAGQVGILVLDVQALSEPSAAFVARIKQQFPQLVVVVAGPREAEGALANLISGGTVYRFIHKPVSPGRAKLFIDAAVRKYAEHHRPFSTGVKLSRSSSYKRLLLGAGIAAMLTLAASIPLLRGKSPPWPAAREQSATSPAEPPTGLSGPQERLLARVENALLEDRLDDAAAAIEAARKAGVDGNRIAYFTAQLAKSREQIRTASTQARVRADARNTHAIPPASTSPVPPAATAGGGGTDPVTRLLSLAAERMKQARLIEPESDSAVGYVKQALQLDPDGNATEAAKQTLSIALLADIHAAIDHREFGRAATLLNSAEGVVAPANLQRSRELLAAAQRQAEATAHDQQLKSALERLHHALELGQYDVARNALDEASALGYAPEGNSLRAQIDAAQSQQQLANVVDAGQLTLVKSVNPVYPARAQAAATQGWVELDFTVGVTGTVGDVMVHAAAPPGVFDQAALRALSQWQYQPVLRDGKAVPQRARIRIRFAL